MQHSHLERAEFTPWAVVGPNPMQEALHASMYALVKEKTADPWQMTAIKVRCRAAADIQPARGAVASRCGLMCTQIIMEGLVPVLILLNPQRAYWRINEDNW